MKIPKINLNTQNKMILIALIISTILVASIAFLMTNQIQKKLTESYNELVKLFTKTLAIESAELIKDIDEKSKYETLKYHAELILESNDNLSYIQFRNVDGDILYTSKIKDGERAKKALMTYSNKMYVTKNAQLYNIGTVDVGFSNEVINSLVKTTKMSMFGFFLLAWILLNLVTIISTWLITKDLQSLYHGVKKISGGQFGYQLEDKNASQDVRELVSAFNDMSYRLHVYEEKNIDQLTLERNKFETVLMSIINGVVVCDNFDKVVLINHMAQKILDVTDENILNTKIQLYCDTNGELCFKEKIEQFKETPLDIIENKPIEFNITIAQKVIKAIISPMFSKNQDYLGYIIVLIDVTKEVEIDKLKSQFISNVSHELRTPVTILRTYVDTLYNHETEFDEETRKEFISIVNSETDRLQKMVNDVLDFSRLESQEANFKRTSCDITKLIAKCVDSMTVLAKEKNISFSIIKEPELPEIVIHEDSILRALNNLVSNAIKYSSDNSKIKIRAEVSSDQQQLEISVEDFGIGIPSEHLAKIFDRFYRVENETHAVKGTGLGLHLVKVTIEKHHHGEVFVTSTQGEGSKFGFRIPFNLPETDEDDYEYHPQTQNND